MENTTKPFYDLCIQQSCLNNFPNVVNKLIKCTKNILVGFRTIAINHIYEDGSTESNSSVKKKATGEKTDIVPEPLMTKDKQYADLKILNRLTIVFSTKQDLQKLMNSKNIAKFDILAVVPRTAEAVQAACESVEADIISIEPDNTKLYKINRKLYNKAVERGLHFELVYFPAILDSMLRKNLIYGSHVYSQTGKSKNVILSSGAINNFALRGPYDVMNLGLIFGLSEERAKIAISAACANVIHHAVGRKLGKVLIIFERSDEKKVINLESDEETMEVDCDEPTQKKIKVN